LDHTLFWTTADLGGIGIIPVDNKPPGYPGPICWASNR
jgi:hypothetical protein